MNYQISQIISRLNMLEQSVAELQKTIPSIDSNTTIVDEPTKVQPNKNKNKVENDSKGTDTING